MDTETTEGAVLTSAEPMSRVRIGVKTSAKGEVYAEFTIEVQVPTGDNGTLQRHLDTLEADVIDRVARIKRTYAAAALDGES